MTIDERLRLPCGICGKGRNQHVGSVHGCPGGYGTYWNPDGERDERVWPRRRPCSTCGKPNDNVNPRNPLCESCDTIQDLNDD